MSTNCPAHRRDTKVSLSSSDTAGTIEFVRTDSRKPTTTEQPSPPTATEHLPPEGRQHCEQAAAERELLALQIAGVI